MAAKYSLKHLPYAGIGYILIGTLLAATGIVLQFAPEFYAASARIVIKDAATRRLTDEFNLMLSQPMLDRAAAQFPQYQSKPTNDILDRWLTSPSGRSRLRKIFRFHQLRGTDIVEFVIEKRSPDGVEAAKLANMVAETYCDFRQLQDTDRYASAARAVEQELSSVFAEIQTIRKRLTNTAEVAGPIDDPEVARLADRLTALQSHRAELRSLLDFQAICSRHRPKAAEILEYATPSTNPSSREHLHGIFVLVFGSLAVVLGLSLIIETRRRNIGPT